MEYRINRRTRDKISVVGLGTSYISEASERDAVEALIYANKHGINYKILDTGIIDMLMFSINPGYDYQHGEYANGSASERMALYRRCEAEGIGISAC